MENYLWIGFIGAVLALLFAAIQRKKVMSYSEGNATMQKIAQSIREGANAYLKHQYSTVAKVFAVVFVVLVIIAFASGGEMLSKFTPFAFLTGGIWSMLAGLIGMKIATNANARTAQAASREPEPRSAGGVLLRRGHGLHRGGPGHAGHQHLADDSPASAPASPILMPAGQHHGDERHGRLLHGSVCPCGRRHLHQGR